MPDIVMPQSVEAEKAVLGAIVLDNNAYLEASEGLSSDDFSLDSHRRIFARMVSLMETRRSVDIVTLVDELDTHKDLKAVGDVAYISSLLDGVPDRPSILSYVQIVREKAMLRRLIHASQAAIERACLQQGDALTILADAESAIAHTTAKPKSDAKSLRELMVPTLDQMSKERKRETELSASRPASPILTSPLVECGPRRHDVGVLLRFRAERSSRQSARQVWRSENEET